MYAYLYSWKEEEYKYIFGLRLRAEERDFHAYRMKEFQIKPYSEWCKNCFKNFQTSMDLDKLKVRFSNLKQKENKPIQHFIEEIRKMYRSMCGTEPSFMNPDNHLFATIYY